jgi:hypothetical protein
MPLAAHLTSCMYTAAANSPQIAAPMACRGKVIQNDLIAER